MIPIELLWTAKKHCAHFACMPKYEKKKVLTMHTKSQNRMRKNIIKTSGFLFGLLQKFVVADNDFLAPPEAKISS